MEGFSVSGNQIPSRWTLSGPFLITQARRGRGKRVTKDLRPPT